MIRRRVLWYVIMHDNQFYKGLLDVKYEYFTVVIFLRIYNIDAGYHICEIHCLC